MANWSSFIDKYANYFSSNQSSGPFVAGKKLAQFYIETIGTAREYPGGNGLNKSAADAFKPILDIGFGLCFYLLSKQNKTYEDIKRDPRYFNAEENSSGNEVPTSPDNAEVESVESIFAKLTYSDYEDIRKKSEVTFKLKEKSSSKSDKIFDYKTTFPLDIRPRQVKLDILGDNKTQIIDTIGKITEIGGLELLEKIFYDYENPIQSGSTVYLDIDIKIDDAVNNAGGFKNLTLQDIVDSVDLATVTYYQEDGTTKIVSYSGVLEESDFYTTYSDAGANSSVQDAMDIDGGFIIDLYAKELGKFIDVVTPYLYNIIDAEELAEDKKIEEELSSGLSINPIELFDSVLSSFQNVSASGSGSSGISALSNLLSSRPLSTPEALGVKTSSGDFINAIAAGSGVPDSSLVFVTTVKDYQQDAVIPIVKIDAKSKSPIIIGSLNIRNIRSEISGVPIIEIVFSLDEKLGLTVVGTDISTRSTDRIFIPNVFGKNPIVDLNLLSGFGGLSGFGPVNNQTGQPAGPAVENPTRSQSEQEEELAIESDIEKLGLDEELDSVVNGLDSETAQKLSSLGIIDKVKRLSKKKDPYDVMATSVVLFWTAFGLVPFSFDSVFPVPPTNLPYGPPGIYLVIFPGLPFGLRKRLRKAFNVAVDPAISLIFDAASSNAITQIPSPENDKFEKDLSTFKQAVDQINAQKVAVRLVATKLSVAFALHMLSLKFLYFGSFQSSIIVPCPGFVLYVS